MPKFSRLKKLPKGFMSVKKFADTASVPISSIYNYMNKGELPFKLEAGKKLIHSNHLRKFK